MQYPNGINTNMTVVYDEILALLLEEIYHLAPGEKFKSKRFKGKTCTVFYPSEELEKAISDYECHMVQAQALGEKILDQRAEQ